jgi:hypothetical protein
MLAGLVEEKDRAKDATKAPEG